MSSFTGRMKEYPALSLDRFDRDNIFSRAYFLSHCHKDHMKGLKGPLLKRKLQFSRTVRLYCSFVTKELLLSNPKYQFWAQFIVPLELESPTQISLVDEASGEKEELVVTLLPAGHCPGSVMFLFEGSQGNVLYTGDFRFAVGDASRMELLHSGSRVKDIQSIYLDSTFYDSRFYQIPTREVCLNGISELIGNWITQSSYHVVWLNCRAAYGYEYLFTNLGETFNTQIHVKNLEMFKKMPEILSYVTTDRRTQIHACRHPKAEEYLQGNRLPCGCTAGDGTRLQIISIKPSTMWFGERTRKTKVIIKTGAFSYRACFSFHSSYAELKDFLTYLQPVNIHPSVIPMGRTLTEVTQMLKLMCRDQSDQTAFVYKPLGVLKRSRMEQTTNDSGSDDDLFDRLGVAPVRKKMGLNQEEEEEKIQSHQRTAPPLSVDESLTRSVADTQSVACDYVDCTESNGEDEEEEEEHEGQGDIKPMKEEVTQEEENKMEAENQEIPKWEDFFYAEMPTDSQNSQSQSCCSYATPSPSRMTSSQTPELFSDDDGEEETPESNDHEPFSLTLSASLSNHSSQNMDSCFPDTLILQPERERGETGTNTVAQRQEDYGPILQSEPEELSHSQASSDFDIPCTPESKAPRPDELSQLYQALASGEEDLLRKGSKGVA
ncbi:protein artemis [Limanda limanda]|uniref:protein artemis n=1 Tax=Limanda limanda TaxID=27771 RepID=UPI0029C92795|nr:protein artemis [Limanda limanda]